MLKWIRKRTRRLSVPSTGDMPCMKEARVDNPSHQHLKDLTNEIRSWTERTNSDDISICPLCRKVKGEDCKGDNSCDCQPEVMSECIENDMSWSTNLIKQSSLYRSHSDVSDRKLARLARRLSPRSRTPIIDTADFALSSSGDESSGYGDSEHSATTSVSGYSSDESATNQCLLQKPEVSAPVTPSQSPLPLMGCRAIYRSASANGRGDVTTPKRPVVRASSVNRTVRPSCGIRRSRSRATSFRREVDEGLAPWKLSCRENNLCTMSDKGHNSCEDYLSGHISQLASIRTELQKLYSLSSAS